MARVLLTIILVCAAAAVIEASSLDYYSYPAYHTSYSVHDPITGDIKGQWEKRDGDKVVGEYRLNDPDGTIRVVNYHASDATGFNAKVDRIGLGYHPSAKILGPIGYHL